MTDDPSKTDDKTKEINDIRFNYVTANRFFVQIDQDVTASFSECAGLGVQIEAEKRMEGGLNDYQRVVLGDPKFSDVTLKRGVTNSKVFWEWMNAVLSSEKLQRRNVSILLYNQAGEIMQSWTLVAAVPVSWKLDALQTSAEGVALEELTLAYESLNIETDNGSGFADLDKGRESSSQIYPGRS